MKRNNLAKLASALFFSLMATISNAEVPNTINYQGFLTNASTGQPQNTIVSVTFKFYDALTAGNLLYTETQSVTPTNGTFNVQIGAVTAFPATLAFDKPYWLEITVDTQTLTPRQPLASSATALRAKVADSLPPVPGTGTNNTAVGTRALQANTTGGSNTASGVQALYSNTTGYDNTASGVQALYSNTTGSSNTASGISALYSNTTGGSNTASGLSALYSNTTGNNNTANGVSALYSNTTGYSNTANGVSALILNTTGFGNTASGVSALFFNTTGYRNTANGTEALFSNAIGYSNTATGNRALFSNTTGNNNVALGFEAGVNLTSGSNNVYIANPGLSSENNVIRIGTGGVHTTVVTAGNLTVAGTVSSASDRNLKENFAAVNAQEVLTKVASLPLQVWNYKQDNPNTRHIGPMAQDFAAAFSVGADDKHIATVDESGVALAAIKGLYEKLLLAEQNSHVKDKEIAKLKSKTKRMDSMERELAAIKAKLGLK